MFLDGDNIKKAISKQAKQALGLPAQNSLQGQSGAGKKKIKKESAKLKNQLTSRQERKDISTSEET